jgi:hypothetical protein
MGRLKAFLPVALAVLTVAGCGQNLGLARQAFGGEFNGLSALAPRRGEFPPTPSGIHLNLVFNYRVRNVRHEIGVIDVGWGAGSPYPKQLANQFYTPFERDGPYAGPAHSLAWWKGHHPSWIEYRCDRKHVAFEYGEREVPFDIANPEVLAYQRTGAVDPALAAGYQGIDFDNLELSNYSRRCGHYMGSGTWVAQYTGKPVDPNYLRDVLAWGRGTFAYVHGFSPRAAMAINFSYDSNFSAERNYDLVTRTDELLDEGGFTNYGSNGHNVTTPQEWRQIVGLIHAVQANDGCYMENGEEPSLSKDITQAERLWVVANYLLIRDDCTYVWMSGFTRSGAQDYGRILLYPEYKLPIGEATASAKAVQNSWERTYSNGLALVNPSNRRVVIPLDGNYVDENGRKYSRSITLDAETGEILLSK